MENVVVRKGTRADAKAFLDMVDSLAKFERLEPPSKEGKKRLVADAFEKKRTHLFVALVGSEPAGYALYFYSYSSFLARPSLYIEDLFVHERYRKMGVGLALFRKCAREAVKQRCGRMEWAVLDWNERAMAFYEKMGARQLKEWRLYRLSDDSLNSVAGSER